MAPRVASTKISYMVDSASEDEFQMPTPDSAVENQAPSRKVKGGASKVTTKATTTKSAKSKPATRRTSGGSVLGVKKEKVAVTKKAPAKKASGKRKALAEREPNASETEEVDEFEDDLQGGPAPQLEPQPVEEKLTKKRGRPKRSAADESVEEVEKPNKAAPRAKAAPKAKSTAKMAKAPKEELTEIPETQPEPVEDDPMDIEPSIEVEEVSEAMPPPPPKPSARPTAHARSESKQRQPIASRRAGSVSDTERGTSDPMLRRTLGETRKKLESMTLKYENMKEVGMSNKETNFDKLKRTTDQRAKDQDEIIASLKQQIASLRSKSSELSSLKRDISKLTEANTKLTAEKKELSTSLASAQNESKTLSSKLAAARSSQPPEQKAPPGSAYKPRSVVLPGTAEAAKDAQMRQLKEGLYSDLTGLVVLNVKKGEDGEDIYDCLQTGRNGTLHFHLSIAESDVYEEAEFAYSPLLDEKRDKSLLDILPDYLTEEICFPRDHAAKFYAKVVDCMTKRVVVEE